MHRNASSIVLCLNLWQVNRNRIESWGQWRFTPRRSGDGFIHQDLSLEGKVKGGPETVRRGQEKYTIALQSLSRITSDKTKWNFTIRFLHLSSLIWESSQILIEMLCGRWSPNKLTIFMISFGYLRKILLMIWQNMKHNLWWICQSWVDVVCLLDLKISSRDFWLS